MKTCLRGRNERTYDAAGQPSGHERKADEEEEACAPDRAGIAKALVAAHAVLVDQVDDEDAEERAQPRDPICEGDVHGHRVVRLIEWRVRVCGEDCSVEERPDSK